jgi:MHS family citrate/tricarballylate:H+ symporter-like MFS transporter
LPAVLEDSTDLFGEGLLRRSLAETEAFRARKHHPTIPQIIRTLATNWAIVLVGMMLVAMTTVSFYLITAYTPSVLRTLWQMWA